ncbi:DUF541 domain-containing protein [Paenibacillus spiritus]|uniref:DUF541 domain-containing protein n=1 Tax=Paenibacillus spiritus TaxID=2496557 RepID=A0A5J5G527_9BACL|nr:MULTISPECIES: SIMPL domain-containing protein [Paenibacillus]KAA9002366.1 DUF541 domain-containing protein [Paenibacillus spiritus]
MRNWIKSAGAVVLAGSLLFGGMALSGAGQEPKKAFAAEESTKNTVSVVGKGELSMKPDIVYLNIGADSSAATAQEAQKANAAKMSKVTTLLKNTWGISDKDLQTAEFYVQPNYTYSEKGGQQVKGYNAHHVVQVAYRDLDKVGALLDAVSGAGANNIGSARFAVEDTSAFEAQVIEKAMANADVKAGAIAKAAKRGLGPVLSVSQSVSTDTPVMYEQAKMMAASTAADADTTISTGEVKVTTQLSVVYQLN